MGKHITMVLLTFHFTLNLYYFNRNKIQSELKRVFRIIMHELTVDIKLNLSFNSFFFFFVLLHSITINIALNLNKKSNPNKSMKPINAYSKHISAFTGSTKIIKKTKKLN